MEEGHGPRESSLLQFRQDQQHRLHGKHDGNVHYLYCVLHYNYRLRLLHKPLPLLGLFAWYKSCFVTAATVHKRIHLPPIGP